MFKRLLIANRGEIACRIIQTARRLGIYSVAVFSDADRRARHVAQADEAFHIGAAPAGESYLLAERIIEAGRRAGADAVHPGYGFLAENAGFAEAVQAAGMQFVGPPPGAIRAMGGKATAKRLMQRAGVAVVPGYHEDDQAEEVLLDAAHSIGFPLFVKAVSGGGGKGMRRVDSPDALAEALHAARREASAAFGDDRVLLERCIERPRHIELQIFADTQGRTVHLFERDCSVQRRHQKVIEEAPAPDLPPQTREAMGAAAIKAAAAIGYVGAGTVEFIVDTAHGLNLNSFFFMEMNTRLQVEHPVTELTTGLDLVEWQLRVAAGEPLPERFGPPLPEGHAIEARLYAEDPARAYLPSTGRLTRLRLPAPQDGIRVDTGVVEGDDVTQHYDPMLAKLIAWGPDRESARRRLGRALAEVDIVGVTSNIGLLRRILAHPDFVEGALDTGLIDRHAAALMPPPAEADDTVLALAVLALLARRAQTNHAVPTDPHSPWAAANGWRLNDDGHDVVVLNSGGAAHAITIHYRRDGRFALVLGDTRMIAEPQDGEPDAVTAIIDGVLRRASVVFADHGLRLQYAGEIYQLDLHDPLHDVEVDEDRVPAMAAPLPGKIIQVLVEAGQEVARGQPLLVLEAMKMEHTLNAPADGSVTEVTCRAGEQVEEGATLIVFAEQGDDA